MAKFTLMYQSSSYVAVPPCGEVLVGFKDAVGDQLDSGTPLAVAKVIGARPLGTNILQGLFGVAGNWRGNKVIQYELEFDDAQFVSEYDQPTCEDIEDITPYTVAMQLALA